MTKPFIALIPLGGDQPGQPTSPMPDNGSHFAARCTERIAPMNTKALYDELCRVFRLSGVYPEYAEHVGVAENGANLWRFRVWHDIFYAVEVDCRPVTVFDAEMMRDKKWAAKMRRKHVGRDARLK